MKISWVYLGLSAFVGLVTIGFVKFPGLVHEQAPTTQSLPHASERHKNAVQVPHASLPSQVALDVSSLPKQTMNHPEQERIESLVTAFKAGNYSLARQLADQTLMDSAVSSKLKDWVRERYPTILTSLAWVNIQAGDCSQATTLLNESKEHSKQIRVPILAETFKGLGFCHYKSKQFEQAEEAMLGYFRHERKDPQMMEIYADLLESQSRFEEAAEVLAALSNDPQPGNSPAEKQVNERLSSMQAKLKESYLQASYSSTHFIITHRTPEHDELAIQAGEILEAALNEFVEIWAMQRPEEHLEVLLYPANKFEHLVSYGPKWASGIFDGRIRIQIKPEFLQSHASNQITSLLRHELVHALLSEQIGRRELPYWFNEGIAMYLECQGGCMPQGPPQNSLGGAFLDQSAFMGKFVELDQGGANLVYRQSLFLIHTLIKNGATLENGNPVLRMISNLNAISSVTSDGLLEPTGHTFDSLHKSAKSAWDSRPLK